MIQRGASLAFAGAAVVASLLFAASPARALDARAEAAAKDALKRAASDFASADYATALARLDVARTGCGVNRCSRTTRGLVMRDLGAMQLRSGDKAAAAISFAEALKIQPELELPTKYGSPDVRAAWDRAKDAAASGRPAPPADQPAGDFTHTPATEQRANTPLPVYVEYPSSSPPAKVVVKYKGPKMSEWGRVDLTKMDDGWGGMIPCADVARGAVRYWIQGVDRSGDPVANSGDPKHPFSVPIRATIAGEAPHLPDQAPPRKCGSNEGSPDAGDDDEGASKGDKGRSGGHESDDEDSSGKATNRGTTRQTYSRLWVGISGALDFLSMPSAHDACLLDPNSGEPTTPSKLYCTNPDGSDFPSRASRTQNMELVPGQAGSIGGGFQAGDARVMLTVDYALNPNILVGGRMGFVANTYSGSAASKDGRAAGFKIHVEGRATYLFGLNPLAHTGFLPMGFAGLGLAEFDGHSTSVVTLSNVAGQQPVDVWRTDGPFFFMFGGGARYQFSPRAACTGALRFNIAAGNGALLTYGPEIGIAYGF